MNDTHPLKKTAVKVLEEWGMMLVEDAPENKADFTADEPILSSEVEMRGTFHGFVSIFAQDSFLTTLAQNLLGSDAPSEDDKRDAFRELGNIMAGNFLTEAYGADLVFDVAQPVVADSNLEAVERLDERRVRFHFHADDSPVAVSFSIQEGA